jgi:hypothetical protein
MANLDWVLMSPEWTQHFPLCSVASLVRIGSDHAPLILNIEEESVAGGAHFHFEKQWLLEPSFKGQVYMNLAESFLTHRCDSA